MIIVPSNVSAAPKGDLYWDYTSLLLTAGDGTGSTNSTFLDSSANNFTVTRAGDVTQGLVSPVSGGGSAYFDGSGDYLEIPNSSAFHFPDDFTLEAWIRPSDTTGRKNIISLRQGSTVGLHFRVDGTDLDLNYGDTNLLAANGSITAGTWQHVVACRSGSTLRVFVNGVIAADRTWTTSATTTAPIRIGTLYNPTGQHFNGHIADVRVVKGTAVYTGNFTPPTEPLTAIPNTSLLLNMNNASIVDRTATNTLAVFGNAQASAAQTKFASRSIYFDGSGDWVTVPDSTDLRPGTGSFTWEFWWYPTALTGYRTPLTKGYAGAGDLALQTGNGDGKLNVVISGSVVVASTIAVTVNTWNHVAVVRDSTTLTIYINGTSGGTASNSSDINSTSAVGVGDASGGSLYPSAGYMEDVRITKGVARYTANFDPPTEAFPVGPYTGPLVPLSATGGTVTEADGYRIHTFTSSGTFTVTGGFNTVEYLVVGGGGGGSGQNGGGGGGGGVLRGSLTSPPASYTVTVGAGGAGQQTNALPGAGGASSFGAVTAGGGGYGGVYTYADGGPGGSPGGGGGGAGAQRQPGTGSAPGGNGANYGGGGGSAGNGVNLDGGPGTADDILGTTYYWGGGGGGSGGFPVAPYSGSGGSGGIGGGGGTFYGSGGGSALNPGGKATANTGDQRINAAGGANTGGGGAGVGALTGGYSGNYGGNGGSGIVIVRYRITA